MESTCSPDPTQPKEPPATERSNDTDIEGLPEQNSNSIKESGGHSPTSTGSPIRVDKNSQSSEETGTRSNNQQVIEPKECSAQCSENAESDAKTKAKSETATSDEGANREESSKEDAQQMPASNDASHSSSSHELNLHSQNPHKEGTDNQCKDTETQTNCHKSIEPQGQEENHIEQHISLEKETVHTSSLTVVTEEGGGGGGEKRGEEKEGKGKEDDDEDDDEEEQQQTDKNKVKDKKEYDEQSSSNDKAQKVTVQISKEQNIKRISGNSHDFLQRSVSEPNIAEKEEQLISKDVSSSKTIKSTKERKRKEREKKRSKKQDKVNKAKEHSTADTETEENEKKSSASGNEESEQACLKTDEHEKTDSPRKKLTSNQENQKDKPKQHKALTLRQSELTFKRVPGDDKKSDKSSSKKEKRSNTLRTKQIQRTTGMKTFSNEMIYNIGHVIMHDKSIGEWFDDQTNMESKEPIPVNDITVFTFDICGHEITIGVRLDSSPINLESDKFSIPSPFLYEMEGQEQTESALLPKQVKVRRDGTVESGTVDGLISFLVDPLKGLDDDFTTSMLFTHKFIISTEELLDLLLQIYKTPLPIKDKSKYKCSKHILDYVEEIRLRVLKFLIRWSSEAPTILTKQNIERIYDFILELKPCHEIVGIYICRCLENISTSLRVHMERVKHFKSRELSVKEVRMLMSLFSLDHAFDDDYFLMLLRGSSFSEKQVYKGQSYNHMFIGSDILVIASMNLSLPSARVGIMAEALSARKDSPIRVLSQVNSNSTKDQFRAFHRLHKTPSGTRVPGQPEFTKRSSEYFGSGLQAENLPTTTFALLGYENDVLRRSPFQSTIFKIKNATEFNILDIDSTEFARQLARYNHSLLRNVTLEELSKPTIGKRGHENEYVNVQECKQRSNQLLSWVLTYILTKKNLSHRAKVVEKFVDIGTKCEQLGDFCSVIILSFAFNQQVICRLKKTMAKLSPDAQDKFKAIADYLGGGNPVKYRKKMKEIRPPFIPSFILVFGDIEKINEQPTFYDDDKRRVRFDKLRCLSGFIQTVNYSRKSVYQYAENITLTNVFPNLKGIEDPNLLREMSKHLED